MPGGELCGFKGHGGNKNYIVVGKDEEGQYRDLLKQTDKLIIVDFSAQWCGPCSMIGPKFKKMADEFPNVIMVKVDVDDSEEIAEEAEISCMPTFHFYRNGEKVDEFSGANEGKLRETVQKNINEAS